MKKLKLYLDTSVVSHLDAPDRLDRQGDTHKFWEILKRDDYDVFISPVVLSEIDRCTESKFLFLLEQLEEIQHLQLLETPEVLALANKYLAAGILTKKKP